MPLRVVADTTFLIKALLWHGPAAACYEACRVGHARLVTSRPILDELARVLAQPKFNSRRVGPIDDYIDDVLSFAEVAAAPKTRLGVDLRDSSDEIILFAAIAGSADLIVTDGNDLLAIGSAAGIAIVRPSDLLHTLGLQHE